VTLPGHEVRKRTAELSRLLSGLTKSLRRPSTQNLAPGTCLYTGLVVAIDQELIDEIIRRVRSAAKPKQIILFGSAAAGRMTRDSDIDLLVVESDPGDAWVKSTRIGDALRGLGYGFDVVVMGAERFEETKGVIGGIAYPANKYGKVIYAGA